jgi:Protein of unknown function (DUF3644)
MSRGLPRRVVELLTKSRESALLAVETYNRPRAAFRTWAYVVLMQIAWTSALLAYFERKGTKPYFRKRGGRKFERIDGQPKRWDLTQCITKFWEGKESPVTKNLQFFIGLRDRIEHRDLPELDVHVFGECQALLFNLETFLDSQFGVHWCIGENLAVPLQLSRVRSKEQNEALRTLLRPRAEDVSKWIERFRSELSADVFETMEYSYKVLLVPNVKNNPSRDTLAVEFVPYEPGKRPELDTAVTLIKERTVPVQNLGYLKPGTVVKEVNKRLPTGLVINLSHHTQCWRFFHVRPAYDDPHPESCDPRYCVYDAVHEDYLYRQDWVELLAKELSDPARFSAIQTFGRPAQPPVNPAPDAPQQAASA